MKKTLNYEIYESYSKKRTTKKYIVVSLRSDYDEVINFARKFFHCSEAHIDFTIGYLYKDEFYLDDPEKRGTKAVGVAYYVR